MARPRAGYAGAPGEGGRDLRAPGETRPDETRAEALARLRPWAERARDFSGWTFDLLRERSLDGPYPWDYPALVREHGARAPAVLELGTGGGERFAEVVDAMPGAVVATEQWHVNAPIAYRRLAPLGVHVVRASSEDGLPFRDASFDLVTARHEGFDPVDVARLLRPGGVLVTQQVYRHNWRELDRYFGARRTDFGDHRARYAAVLEAAGLAVESREHHRRIAYPSLGEFVYMLSVAPWEIAGFDVERDLDALLALERDCTTEDGLVLTECRYLMTARKPGASTV